MYLRSQDLREQSRPDRHAPDPEERRDPAEIRSPDIVIDDRQVRSPEDRRVRSSIPDAEPVPSPGSHTDTGGLIAGVLVALLLVLAVWYFGFEAQGAGSGIDVDLPAAPAAEIQPTD